MAGGGVCPVAGLQLRAAQMVAAMVAVRRIISLSPLLFLQHEPTLEPATIWVLLGNFQDQLVRVGRETAYEPDPLTAFALTQNLYRLAVQPPGGLGSGTLKVLEIPRRAIQVQNRAGTGSAAVRLNRLYRKNLALSVRLDSQDQAPRSNTSGQCGSAWVQLPGSECLRESRRSHRSPCEKTSHASQCGRQSRETSAKG